MQPSSVCQLFNSSMADHPVPAPLLQEVHDHKDLREVMDKQSVFAGRNPLVSSVAVIMIVVIS